MVTRRRSPSPGWRPTGKRPTPSSEQVWALVPPPCWSTRWTSAAASTSTALVHPVPRPHRAPTSTSWQGVRRWRSPTSARVTPRTGCRRWGRSRLTALPVSSQCGRYGIRGARSSGMRRVPSLADPIFRGRVSPRSAGSVTNAQDGPRESRYVCSIRSTITCSIPGEHSAQVPMADKQQVGGFECLSAHRAPEHPERHDGSHRHPSSSTQVMCSPLPAIPDDPCSASWQ